MLPIKDINDVVQCWHQFNHFEEEGALFAFFLYTDEDRTLAGYVREHFNSLNELSGNYCLIFLIDQPSRDSSAYWREFTFKKAEEELTWSRPYDKAKAYDIADHFGIPPREMPCIVFFKSIYDKDLLVLPLENSWREKDLRKQFRDIFTVFRQMGRKKNLLRRFLDIFNVFRPATEQVDVDVIVGIAKKRAALWDALSSHIRKRRLQAAMHRIAAQPGLRTIGEVLKKLALSAD